MIFSLSEPITLSRVPIPCSSASVYAKHSLQDHLHHILEIPTSLLCCRPDVITSMYSTFVDNFDLSTSTTRTFLNWILDMCSWAKVHRLPAMICGRCLRFLYAIKSVCKDCFEGLVVRPPTLGGCKWCSQACPDSRRRFFFGDDTVAVAMRFAMQTGQICFFTTEIPSDFVCN